MRFRVSVENLKVTAEGDTADSIQTYQDVCDVADGIAAKIATRANLSLRQMLPGEASMKASFEFDAIFTEDGK